MGTDWTDPKWSSSILKKGQRKPKPKPVQVEAIAIPDDKYRKCEWCGNPIFVGVTPHCTCSIWDYAKPKKPFTSQAQ